MTVRIDHLTVLACFIEFSRLPSIDLLPLLAASGRGGKRGLVQLWAVDTSGRSTFNARSKLAKYHSWSFMVASRWHGMSFTLASMRMVTCQTIGSAGITAGIVVVDQNHLEELSVQL